MSHSVGATEVLLYVNQSHVIQLYKGVFSSKTVSKILIQWRFFFFKTVSQIKIFLTRQILIFEIVLEGKKQTDR